MSINRVQSLHLPVRDAQAREFVTLRRQDIQATGHSGAGVPPRTRLLSRLALSTYTITGPEARTTRPNGALVQLGVT